MKAFGKGETEAHISKLEQFELGKISIETGHLSEMNQ